MLSPSYAPLRARLRTADDHAAARFMADETARCSLADLEEAGTSAALHGSLRNRVILLAMPTQFATIAALVALDGIARRVILWPSDLSREQIHAIIEPAGVDVVLEQWPPRVDANAAPLSASHAAMIDPAPTATEWVLFTSGTSGRPKMVVHTQRSLAGHIVSPPAGAGPVWATFYDIRRYGGLQVALRALLGGGSLVLSCPTETPAAFLERAATAGATHFLGTPSHWRRALMSDAAGRLSPSYVRLSGEVADQMILDKLRATYPSATIVHAFASTEAGLAFEVDDGRAGFPAAVIEQATGLGEIRIEQGTLQIRSARNAAGYLDGRITALAGHEGFVDTGDVVQLCDGRYYFAGRRDGTVNIGGQKVHPEEVEAVINQHPDVEMSLVTGRRSPITGAIVVAQVVVRGSSAACTAQALEADIKAFCRGRLPPHKVPASVRAVPHLDIAPSGKLVRLSA